MALSFIALPLGLMFLISGFLINGLQVLSLVLLLFSRKAYRIANMIMMDILWSELVWLLDWWAGVKVRLYADDEALKVLGREHALLICNHRSDIDWLVGWLLAQRFGCLGGTRAVMKQSVKFLPVIGWSMYFSEYVFLARSWAKDEVTLQAGYRGLKGFPRPFWLALFVEGTRFTQKKLEAAQEYAASVNVHIPQNVLIPRTKGFVSAIANLREFVPAVYDMTLAVSNDSPNPTMSGILKGQSSTIHVHLRRVPIETLPKTDEEVAAWCKEAFVRKLVKALLGNSVAKYEIVTVRELLALRPANPAKAQWDAMLDEHKKINSFGEDLYQPIPRTKAPLLIVIGWGFFLLTSSIWLLRDVLSTWRGCLYIAGALSLISILLEVLIGASQAERSKGPKSNSRSSVKNSAAVKTDEKKNK